MNPLPDSPAPLVRISLPSKGALGDTSMRFLSDCGLQVDKTNPRQYQAHIRSLPEVVVLFQRPGDIVVSVQNGSVDFGITGLDVVAERECESCNLMILHDALGYGYCTLTLAVPETWENVLDVASLRQYTQSLGRPVRVATKFPNLTGRFLAEHDIPHTLIAAEGTLETIPTIGYADMISDLVASGQTLRDNRLRPLVDGVIQPSQAVLIANRQALQQNPAALRVAHYLLEFFEAHLRASDNLAIFANMRGTSPESIAALIFSQPTIGGLQGPTISQVIVRDGDPNWHAVNIIVRRSEIFLAINELRAIGGSGVVVQPVTYIFDEEPPRYTAMLQSLGLPAANGG